MSSKVPEDAAKGRARRDSVADLVYTSFRRRVDNPKHLYYLFPPDYRRQVVQFDPGEEHRANMFKRRNSLRSSTRSEGGARVKWGRRKHSVAPDVTSPPVNDIPDDRKLTRARSQSVPMVKLEPSGDDDQGPSRLQVRRSTNAYLELMWPRFFGSNRDIHEASERTPSRRHSEAGIVHSRHSSGGGGSVGGHSRHNSGGGSNSSRRNSDSMSILEEEAGLNGLMHDSGIHPGSSRSSLTSLTSMGDVFLDDVITPGSSTHSLHNLKPEVEMRRRAASQSYLQHRATQNSHCSASQESASERDRQEQILNPRALLLSSSSGGEEHGRGLPPRPSSYSGTGNEKQKEPLKKDPSNSRSSSGSRRGDELVQREESGKKPESRPKSDVELRYEDVLDHLMWDVEVPAKPSPEASNEKKDTQENNNPTKVQLTVPASIVFSDKENDLPNEFITPVNSSHNLQNIPDHPVAKLRRKAFAQSYSKQHSSADLPGPEGSNVMETNLDDLPSATSVSNPNKTQSQLSPLARESACGSKSQLHQGGEPYLEPGIQEQLTESRANQGERQSGQKLLNPLDDSNSQNRVEANLDGAPSDTSYKTLNNTHPKQPLPTDIRLQDINLKMDTKKQQEESMPYQKAFEDGAMWGAPTSLNRLDVDSFPPYQASGTPNDVFSNQPIAAGLSTSRSVDHLGQGQEPNMELGTQKQPNKSIHNQQASQHDPNSQGISGSRNSMEPNLDDHPIKATSEGPNIQRPIQAHSDRKDDSRFVYPLEQEALLSSSLPLINNPDIGEKDSNNQSRWSRRLSSSSLDGDRPTSRPTSRVDQLIPNPWHSRYSDSSLNLLDVTPGPENPESPDGAGTTSTDSDGAEGSGNINVEACRGDNVLNQKRIHQGKCYVQGDTHTNISVARSSKINKALEGDKQTEVMESTKVGKNQEGYQEDVFMGDAGTGGMLQATNNQNVSDMTDERKPLMDANKDDTVYTFTSVIEWSRDNSQDKPPSPDGPKCNDDDDSTKYTFSSKIEWNRQSQGGDEKEPLLAGDIAQQANVLGSASKDGDDAKLEAYLDDVIQRHSSIVLEAEADDQISTGKSSSLSDDKIRRQTSVGVNTNPETQFTTRNDDGKMRKHSNTGTHASMGPKYTNGSIEKQHESKGVNDEIPRQINFGVHDSLGPKPNERNKDRSPSKSRTVRGKNDKDSEPNRYESGITEKWTLLSQGHAENTKVNSRSKGYGALQSGDYQDCRVRKGSVKLEKLKTKKVFTLCCFPFEFYW